MTKKTLVDKAGATVGVGIEMASDVAGAIKTAFGGAIRHKIDRPHLIATAGRNSGCLSANGPSFAYSGSLYFEIPLMAEMGSNQNSKTTA